MRVSPGINAIKLPRQLPGEFKKVARYSRSGGDTEAARKRENARERGVGEGITEGQSAVVSAD